MSKLSILEVKGVDCPRKFLVLGDGEPVIFCNTGPVAAEVVSFLVGNDEALLPKTTKAFLQKIREKLNTDC